MRARATRSAAAADEAAAPDASAAGVDETDALLPQTQCRQCGYPGCRAYAQAMVLGQADVDRCPPGGPLVAARLAQRLARPVRPVDPSRGRIGPFTLARIEESACIGCAACIRACPVDAIVGARKRMHTVIESECTGCELCVARCPVDCITLVAMPSPEGVREGSGADFGEFLRAWMSERAPRARARFERRARRLRARSTRDGSGAGVPGRPDRAAVVAAAVSRVRSRRRAAAMPARHEAQAGRG